MTNKQKLNAVRRARRNLKLADGFNPSGSHYRAVLDVLDVLEQEYKPKPASWQNIGPVQPGGKSLLDMSLTHDTSGIPLFPAVDTAWGGGGGVLVCVPEDCVVDTKDTSAGPGEAVYMTGKSGMRYWIGHLNRDWALGTTFAKGVVIGKTLPIPGSSDHAHVGVNAEAFLGKGKELKWGRTGKGPRYTLGAPTIREQLLALEV